MWPLLAGNSLVYYKMETKPSLMNVLFKSYHCYVFHHLKAKDIIKIKGKFAPFSNKLSFETMEDLFHLFISWCLY